MKQLLLFFAIAMLLVACTKPRKSHSPEAQDRAMKVAIELAQADSTDTVAMQAILLKQEAMRSEYELANDLEAAQEFDATFRSVLEQKNQQRAKEIFK